MLVVSTFIELLAAWYADQPDAFDDNDSPSHGHEGYMTKEELLLHLTSHVDDQAGRLEYRGPELLATNKLIDTELRQLVDAADGSMLFRRARARNPGVGAKPVMVRLYRLQGAPGAEPAGAAALPTRVCT